MKLILILLSICIYINASTLDLISLNKKIDFLQHKIINLEKHNLLMNENLKRIDFNFEQIMSILNDLKYKTNYRKNKIQIKHTITFANDITKNQTIFNILKNGYIYKDINGINKLNKVYKNDLIEIENCNKCKEKKNCFCKITNREAYINIDLLR